MKTKKESKLADYSANELIRILVGLPIKSFEDNKAKRAVKPQQFSTTPQLPIKLEDHINYPITFNVLLCLIHRQGNHVKLPIDYIMEDFPNYELLKTSLAKLVTMIGNFYEEQIIDYTLHFKEIPSGADEIKDIDFFITHNGKDNSQTLDFVDTLDKVREVCYFKKRK